MNLILIICIAISATSVILLVRYLFVKHLLSLSINKYIPEKRSLKDVMKRIYPSARFNEVSTIPALDQAETKSFSKKTVDTEIKKTFDRFSVLSGLGESAWFGADAIHNLQEIDSHFLDTISQLAHTQMNSIADLHSYLNDWAQNWYGGLKDGVINQLQGHLAEQYVADHLQQMGHHVVMAENSNQAGLDMWVDGHPFNVKDVQDFSTIYQHFDKYPDIGVIANSDIQGNIPAEVLHLDPAQSIDQLSHLDNLPHEHLMVIDQSLNLADVTSQTHEASDAALGHIDAHIPVITLALSSFREIKLLFKNHTDIVTAIKNIGLDLAGTGLGGLAGAKAGAAIGTLITPGVGTVIGGVIGAIGGALGGRYVSNQAKMEPLKKAKEHYEVAFQQYKAKLETVSQSIQTDYKKTVDLENNKLQDLVKNKIAWLEEKKVELQINQKNQYQLSDQQLQYLFQTAVSRLSDNLAKVDASISKLPVFSKIFPSVQYIRLLSHRNHLCAAIKETKKASLLCLSATSAATQQEKTTISLEFLSAIGVVEEDIFSHLKKYSETSESAKSAFIKEYEATKQMLIQKRITVFQLLSSKLDELKNWARDQLSGSISRLEDTQNKLLSEMKKFGLVLE